MIYFLPTPSRIPALCDTRSFFGNAAGCKLFMNERDSDVSISVDWDNRKWHFPAHKLILSCMSEVFRIMFSTDMCESMSGQIIIQDHSPLTVKQFLKYLYMGTLDFNGWVEAVDLLKIAHKYGVHTLVTLCETYLISVTSFSNVCYLYDLAQTYSLINLRKNSSNFVLDTAFVVSATEGFFNLTPKSLAHFLSSNKLNVENECCVLSALREWAVVECSRRGTHLTRNNILSAMEPFLKHVKWELIPEELRTFVPTDLVDKYSGQSQGRRRAFYVPSAIQYHVTIFKFVVELGAFCDTKACDNGGLCCLKFGVDCHVFVAGFRIVGMFKVNSLIALGPSSLTLGRDDNRSYTQFNLNSLPWTKGTTVGDYVWREMTAYLPYPVRVDPFSVYAINLKYGMRGDAIVAKWPITRLENFGTVSDLGPINFHVHSQSYGLTQLLLLPAPPNRNNCCDTNDV